ncbi:methyltransferase domain-containing protein [Candidatus Woesearchaeota archaeon]|nr:methyltransferase domain-containing protein [Candidatus Woesearchaeota archaeon]
MAEQNKGIAQNRDIATVFSDAYSRCLPKVLGDQHSFLLDSLESHLSSHPNGTLLVLGPSGQVLPYSCQYTHDGKFGSSNRQRIKNMIGNGKIILLDYVAEFAKSGLIRALDTLTQFGFFSDNYFRLDKFALDEDLNPNRLESTTISFILNNLKDNLRIADNSVTAVDANLSIHHASVTKLELEKVYREIFRVLQPGGLLHLGEGNVNMNYSEDKLIRIGQDLASILDSSVLIRDEREHKPDYVLTSFFEVGKSYDALPLISKTESASLTNYVPVNINKGGFVIISLNQRKYNIVNGLIGTFTKPSEIKSALRNKDYKQISVFECSGGIVIPLIDTKMPEDIERHIIPVNRFYDEIQRRANGYSGIDDELVTQISKGIEFERHNALKGIVEFYMGESIIINALQKVGFVDIHATHHRTEPFYNITAKKPK